jgi:hypothetical protein
MLGSWFFQPKLVKVEYDLRGTKDKSGLACCLLFHEEWVAVFSSYFSADSNNSQNPPAIASKGRWRYSEEMSKIQTRPTHKKKGKTD